MAFSNNVGTIDRTLRIVAGIALLAVAILTKLSSAATIGMIVVGIVLIATALISFCPLYSIIGLQTSKKD